MSIQVVKPGQKIKVHDGDIVVSGKVTEVIEPDFIRWVDEKKRKHMGIWFEGRWDIKF